MFDRCRAVAALSVVGLALALPAVLGSCGKSADGESVSIEQKIERGRYLVKIGGCNECHTPGFAQAGYSIPEKQWLAGLPIGWKGPWGTTYASNLRKTVQAYSEESFVKSMKTARHHTGQPPMPWTALEAMTEQDLACLHAYIKSLGDGGEPMPSRVGPEEEPKGPYFDMNPKNLPQGAATSSAPAVRESR